VFSSIVLHIILNHLTLTAAYRQISFRCICAIFICLISCALSGQKDALKKANAAYDEDKYREALVYYNRIDGIEKSGPLLFKRGVCQYELNQVSLAAADFRQAYQYGYRNPDIDLYTGMISHNKGKFAEAAEYYKIYLQQTSIESGDRDRVRQLIKQCGRAEDLSYFKPIAIVERVSKGVNTVFDDIGMIPSPTKEGKYYFSSNRPNTAMSMDASDFDIYYVNSNKGTWSETGRLPYAINRSKEDILIGFTQGADGLIFFRGEQYDGAITINKGSGDERSTKAVDIPAKFNYQTSDAFFYDDNLVLFSARLSDTYGGYDLYYTKSENGKWTKPKNLGPDINGPFDEVSPYLTADGSELYYSSNRNESIGGHDIFFASFLYEAERWSAPANLGIPINSPGDDLHFELSYNGLIATFSSDRKTALGGLDIFLARFKSPRGQQTYSSNYLPFADYRIVVNENPVASTPIEEVLEEETTSVNDDPIAATPATTPPEDKDVVAVNDEVIQEKEVITTPTKEVNTTVIETPKEVIQTPDVTESNIKIEPTSTLKEQSSTTIEITAIDTSNTGLPTEPSTSSSITKTAETPNPATRRNAQPKIEIPTETLAWSPLYFNNGKEVLEKKNLRQVEIIKAYLDRYQDISVDIICHSNNTGILEFKLFSSIKLAERIEDYLLEQGIQSRRLSTKSYADNYPVAKVESQGGGPGLADMYNARIEFSFYNSSGLPMPIERVEPDLPAHSYDNRFDIFEALTDNSVVYKIQIATVSQMYRAMTLSQFNDAAVEVDPVTGLYLYTIGLYDNYTEAQQIKRDVERSGITDARILPYYDGRRLMDDQLVYYVNEFPDLQRFMNYGN